MTAAYLERVRLITNHECNETLRSLSGLRYLLPESQELVNADGKYK